MDPDINVREQLDLATRILRRYDNGGRVGTQDPARLAELVMALDQWLRQGGFTPKRWARTSA
jgi:hypothetical protein